MDNSSICRANLGLTEQKLIDQPPRYQKSRNEAVARLRDIAEENLKQSIQRIRKPDKKSDLN